MLKVFTYSYKTQILVRERKALPNTENEHQSVTVAQYREKILKAISYSAQSWPLELGKTGLHTLVQVFMCIYR